MAKVRIHGVDEEISRLRQQMITAEEWKAIGVRLAALRRRLGAELAGHNDEEVRSALIAGDPVLRHEGGRKLLDRWVSEISAMER